MMLIAQHLRRWRLEVPYDADKAQSFEQVIGRVDFPPTEALPHAALVRMVVVVPTLPHRKQRQKPVVAGIVSRQVPLPAADMRERIDAERRVIDQHGAPEEPN